MSLPPTRLRLLRLIRGWSLDEMAARSGIARTTITNCENGLHAKALVSLAAFLGETDPERLLDRVTSLESAQ